MKKPNENMKTESLSMGDILERSYYEVGRNQRDYSWEESELDSFWTDLTACIKDSDPGEQNPIGHFLGFIVVSGQVETSSDDRQRVVDGQQRLTTFTLLARILLDSIDSRARFEEIHGLTQNLTHRIFVEEAGVRHPRIKLCRDDDFYQKSVVELTDSEERRKWWSSEDTDKKPVRKRIKEAMEGFEQKVTEYLTVNADDPDNKRSPIAQITDVLCGQFYAVKVSADNTRTIYRMFETLNHRGMDLTQAQLVLNVVLEHAEKEGKDEFNVACEVWESFMAAVESQQPEMLNATELIQYSYSSRHKDEKEEALFDEVSEQLHLGETNGGLAPLSFVYELWEDAEKWERFIQGNSNYWTDRTKDSHYFIRTALWKKHATPLLLAIAHQFDKPGKKSELEKALWAVECYLFRQGIICKVNIEKLREILGDAARMLQKDEDLDDVIEYLKGHSPDGEFVEAFKIAKASSSKVAFYVGWRMEEEEMKSGGTAISPRKQSPTQHVEHILPKKPSPAWGGIEEEEEFKSYRDRLGNHLVLEQPINSHIKNKDIEYKIRNDEKKGYENSKLTFPSKFIEKKGDWLDQGKWTFKSIKKRQEYLAHEFALKTWEF